MTVATDPVIFKMGNSMSNLISYAIGTKFELAERSADAGYVLTDCFANTPVNQARSLVWTRNL